VYTDPVQAVFRVVGDLQRFIEVAGLEDASTGPKISSCAMRAWGATSANTVGWMKYPCPEASPPPYERPSFLADLNDSMMDCFARALITDP